MPARQLAAMWTVHGFAHSKNPASIFRRDASVVAALFPRRQWTSARHSPHILQQKLCQDYRGGNSAARPTGCQALLGACPFSKSRFRTGGVPARLLVCAKNKRFSGPEETVIPNFVGR
jgi:hypothetical protein